MSVQYEPSKRRTHYVDGRSITAIFTIGRPSVIPAIALPSLGMTAWSAGVVGAWYASPSGTWLKLLPASQLLISILGVVMGLLLVFRTNTAYDRFYEGRKVWAVAQSTIRSIARLISVGVKASTPEQEERKKGAFNLLVAFAGATKHHMRSERGFMYNDLGPYLAHIPAFKPTTAVAENAEGRTAQSSSHLDNVKANSVDFGTLPIDIVFRIQKYISYSKETDQMDGNVQLSLGLHVNTLAECVAIFDRIKSTPIPLAYELHVKQTLIVYLLSLPFQLVILLEWYTIPAMFVCAFTLLGIEAVSGEIENPFGYDPNDLPQDEFCDTIREEVYALLDE